MFAHVCAGSIPCAVVYALKERLNCDRDTFVPRIARPTRKQAALFLASLPVFSGARCPLLPIVSPSPLPPDRAGTFTYARSQQCSSCIFSRPSIVVAVTRVAWNKRLYRFCCTSLEEPYAPVCSMQIFDGWNIVVAVGRAVCLLGDARGTTVHRSYRFCRMPRGGAVRCLFPANFGSVECYY